MGRATEFGLGSKPSSVHARRAPREGGRTRELEQLLLGRAASGDAIAARELVVQHHARMYALAQRVIGDPVEAEDLVQEAFVRAFSHCDRFNPRYRLSTWLRHIVLNSCRDHLKSPRRRERPCSEQLDSGFGAAEPEADPLIVDQRARRLRRALAELRPQYREIIVMKDILGLSFEEIRDLTGTPITGLKIRAIRARARLRQLLEANV